MPAKAAIDEECPLGNELLCNTPLWSCQTGRARPRTSLMAVVASEVTIITPMARIAALR